MMKTAGKDWFSSSTVGSAAAGELCRMHQLADPAEQGSNAADGRLLIRQKPLADNERKSSVLLFIIQLPSILNSSTLLLKTL
ncbi:hypothetical protein MHH28_17155 [Paenibacillus sp. FSL K6-1217]|uniref:hypothetical protein n=1 Tax=Paenibacillus sp. FSL K6-1217 TaxID=2921466 RepID=UPI003251CA82